MNGCLLTSLWLHRYCQFHQLFLIRESDSRKAATEG